MTTRSFNVAVRLVEIVRDHARARSHLDARALTATTLLVVCTGLIATSASTGAHAVVAFTQTEREAVARHGPWPPPLKPDPGNRHSGKPAAIAFGRASSSMGACPRTRPTPARVVTSPTSSGPTARQEAMVATFDAARVDTESADMMSRVVDRVLHL